MRLLRLQDDGELACSNMLGGISHDNAILSHSWGAHLEEVIHLRLISSAFVPVQQKTMSPLSTYLAFTQLKSAVASLVKASCPMSGSSKSGSTP